MRFGKRSKWKDLLGTRGTKFILVDRTQRDDNKRMNETEPKITQNIWLWV